MPAWFPVHMAVRSRTTLAVVLSVLLVAAVACGDGNGEADGEKRPTTAPTTAFVPGPTTPPSPPGPELVRNPSFEELGPNGRPLGWSEVGWGDNDRSFSVIDQGARTGGMAARAEITRYVDGGATWAFEPIAVQPSSSYRVTSHYRSDAPVEMLIVETDAAGVQSYPMHQVTDASSGWSEFDAMVTTSATAVTITLYQSIEEVGWVEVDDVSLRTYTPRRLQRPLVSLTFDDGYRSHLEVATPVLRDAGLRGTFYVVSGFLGDPKHRYLTEPMVKELFDAGMEIGSHTVDHERLSELRPRDVRHQLADSRKALEELIGVPVEDLASPYGDSSTEVRDEIRARYRSHRSVEGRHNLPEFLDLSNLEARLIEETTTPAEVEQWIAEAEAEGGWLILIFHDITEKPAEYDTTPDDFRAMIDAVERSDLTVRTVAEARREVLAQT